MHRHEMRIPASLQVRQFLSSLKPLSTAGVLRTGGPKESAGLLRALSKWGMSLAALCEMGVVSFPERTALVDDHGELTYRELRDQGKALARSLAGRRDPEDPVESVSLITRNSRGLVLSLIAAAYLGAEARILNPACSLRQLNEFNADHPSDATFIDAELDEVIAGLEAENKIVAAEWSGDDQGFPRQDELIEEGLTGCYRTVELPERPSQKPTAIMSSGTRGIPKAVVLPVPRTPKVLGTILERIPFRPGDVIELTVGMFHAWGWLNLQIAIATGSTLVTHRWFNAETEIEDLQTRRVTGMVSSAVYLREVLELVEEGAVDVSQVRYIVSAGNAIPPELVVALNKRFGDRNGVVHNFYGTTEHGQITLTSAADLMEDPTSAGRPGSGVRLEIISEDGTSLPPHEIGVIYSSNSMTSMGFLSDKDSSDVFDGMLSTGDKGYLDETGRLYVCGRADDMVIRGGENIYPRIIEEYLLTVPEIDDAFVIGSQEDLVAQLDAYVVVEGDITDEEINQLVVDNVTKFASLDNIVRVDYLPRNDSGKVVPRELPSIN